jgi:hypothetical protein
LTADESIAEGKASLDNCINSNGCEYNLDVGSTAPGTSDTFVVFGYSQSATIATLEKRSLADQFPPGQGPSVSFVVIANGNRPNGGILARGPRGFTIPQPLLFGGITFSGPTPTNTQYNTVDIAGQYDIWADQPVNPLNLLAVANVYMGSVHSNYSNVSLSDPGVVYQGQLGDTTYYLIPTPILPLLAPLQQVPLVGYPLADALDAPLRVLVEAGYNRTISPGQPTPWNPLYFPDPIALGINFLVAIPTGLDNGLQDIIGTRPFGTQRPGPYGVGGPDVTYVNPPATTATTQPTAPTIPVMFSPHSGLDALANPVTVMKDFAKFSQLRSDLNRGVPVSTPSPLSAAAGLPSLTNPAADVPDPGAAAGQSFNALSKYVPVGDSTTAANPQSSSGRKPGDGIRAAAGAIQRSFSGNTASTSTTTGRPTSVTSTTTRPEASSSTSSSPGSDNTP